MGRPERSRRLRSRNLAGLPSRHEYTSKHCSAFDPQFRAGADDDPMLTVPNAEGDLLEVVKSTQQRVTATPRADRSAVLRNVREGGSISRGGRARNRDVCPKLLD